LSELGITSLETFILSLATETHNNADIKRLWAVLEEFVDQGKIDSLGIADLLLADLTELYNSSKVDIFSTDNQSRTVNGVSGVNIGGLAYVCDDR
jgi:diketogulonate reductase-like aldo/keto reductase